MRKFRVAASTMVLAGALALSACDNVTYYKGVSFGPPPPLVSGPAGFAPGPGWVWTDGFYVWNGNRWVWQPGRWQRPPHPGWAWRNPWYEPWRGGYRLHRGHWVRHL